MKKLVRIGKIIILAVAFIVVAFPFFWCLMLSFKSNAEIMSIPTTFFHQNGSYPDIRKY